VHVVDEVPGCGSGNAGPAQSNVSIDCELDARPGTAQWSPACRVGARWWSAMGRARRVDYDRLDIQPRRVGAAWRRRVMKSHAPAITIIAATTSATINPTLDDDDDDDEVLVA
jgi:hypothetical protein